MSAIRLENVNIGQPYEDEVISKNLLKIGHNKIGFTNMNTEDEPTIEPGSSLEVDGFIYLWDEGDSISGSLVGIEGTVFIKTLIDESGELFLIYDSAMIELPEWSFLKKGYYDENGDKVIASLSFSDSNGTFSDKEFHL